jgi:hypothetical protein
MPGRRSQIQTGSVIVQRRSSEAVELVAGFWADRRARGRASGWLSDGPGNLASASVIEAVQAFERWISRLIRDLRLSRWYKRNRSGTGKLTRRGAKRMIRAKRSG